jgi:cyanophycinase
MAGPIALVGSGEYTDAMLDVDKHLLDGRPRRYVQIPTAAAPEGDAKLNHWISMGIRHAERLDAEPVPLVVRTREDAEDPKLIDLLTQEQPGLVYFSGGNPLYLTETFRDTALWQAIYRLWENGTALGGCSAGAMAFGGWVPDVRHPTRPGAPGLRLVPQLRVLPHFDKFLGRVPDLMLRPVLRPKEGMRIVGIDEDTALVNDGDRSDWTVMGRSSAWLLDGGRRQPVPSGVTVTL